jgi:hypothetical protein
VDLSFEALTFGETSREELHPLKSTPAKSVANKYDAAIGVTELDQENLAILNHLEVINQQNSLSLDEVHLSHLVD